MGTTVNKELLESDWCYRRGRMLFLGQRGAWLLGRLGDLRAWQRGGCLCLDSAAQYISMRGRGQEAALGRVKILVFSDLFVRKWSLEVTQLSLYLPGLRGEEVVRG